MAEVEAQEPTGRTFLWHGRKQIVDAMPPGGRQQCSRSDCEREECFCQRCVYPEGYPDLMTAGWCHECKAEALEWGPGRKLNHCPSCTCRENEGDYA